VIITDSSEKQVVHPSIPPRKRRNPDETSKPEKQTKKEKVPGEPPRKKYCTK